MSSFANAVRNELTVWLCERLCLAFASHLVLQTRDIYGVAPLTIAMSSYGQHDPSMPKILEPFCG
jgi:hypothetical protein